MKIIDIVHVVGRGYIFIGQPDAAIHIGDKMRYNGQEFNICGIEKTHISKKVGLVLSHSEAAYEAIHIGDEVEIIAEGKTQMIDEACIAYCKVCDTQECGGTGECDWVAKFRAQLVKQVLINNKEE
jgi:hypothetical protein